MTQVAVQDNIQAIYERLASAPVFHPGSAELLDDMSIQAGDVITMQQGGTSYPMPVYSQTIHWNGAATATVNSTGNEKREPLPALARRQYGTGRAIAQQEKKTSELSVWVETFQGTDLYQQQDKIVTVSGMYDIVHDSAGDHFRLRDGAILEVNMNSTYQSVATLLNSHQISILGLDTWVDNFTGTALYMNRDNISAVCGEFTVVTSGSTKTVRVINGTGLALYRDGTEYGVYDSGNLTAGIVVGKLNAQTTSGQTYVKIKADVVDLGAYATVGALNAVQAEIDNLTVTEGQARYLQSDKVYALSGLYVASPSGKLYYRNTEYGPRGIVMGVSSYFISGNALMQDPSSSSPLNLNHYHKIEATEGTGSDDGKIVITLSDPIATTDTTHSTTTFDIAATRKYQADVAAARYVGKASVSLTDPSWEPLSASQTLPGRIRWVKVSTVNRTDASGTADELTKQLNLRLTQGGWSTSSNTKVVVMRTESDQGQEWMRITVDGTEMRTAGQNDVSLESTFTWTNSPSASVTSTSNTASISTTGRTTAVTRTLPLYMNSSAWSGNKKYVYVTQTDSQDSNRVARYEVDASSLVTNATYAGKASVLLTPSAWDDSTGTDDNNKVTISTSGRTDSSGNTDELSRTVGLFMTTSGTWSSSNEMTVYIRENSTSGLVRARKTVNASSVRIAGQNDVSLETTFSWSTTPSASVTSNTNTASISTTGRGTAITRSLALYMDSDVWTSDYKKYVYVSHTNSLSANRVARYTVDASSIYSQGHDAVIGAEIDLNGSSATTSETRPTTNITKANGAFSGYVWIQLSDGTWKNLRSFSFSMPGNTMASWTRSQIGTSGMYRYACTVAGATYTHDFSS